MGFIDTLKGLVGGHKQQTEQGVDKATTDADEKMGGAHSQQMQEGDEKAADEINKLPE
jgi:hypothetical protein